MPDFDKVINNQPHWSIIRIKRGMAGMKPLIEEALSLHGQLLDMDNVPTSSAAALTNTASWGSMGVTQLPDLPEDAEDAAAAAAASRLRREARLTALMNGVTEGFVVG